MQNFFYMVTKGLIRNGKDGILVKQAGLKRRQILALDGKTDRKATAADPLNHHSTGTGFRQNADVITTFGHPSGAANIRGDNSDLWKPNRFLFCHPKRTRQ